AAIAAWVEAEGAAAAEGARPELARAAEGERSAYDRLVEQAADREREPFEAVAAAVGAALARAVPGVDVDPARLDDAGLDRAGLAALEARHAGARCSDGARHANRGAPAARRAGAAMLLAGAVAATARA